MNRSARRILIVPDKFKGSLPAAAVAAALRRGWRQVRPNDRLDLLPMSDGGDGFGDVMRRLLGARRRVLSTVDAAHRRCRAAWWFHPTRRQAIVETATVIGLAQLPRGRFHPFELDTWGLGRVFERAQSAGAAECLVGIGGSATNDGGFGLARALGWRFIDHRGRVIERWVELRRLSRVEPPRSPTLTGLRVTVAVDVENRLLGARGCSRIYGPQKGLGPADFALAEACLGRLARVVADREGKDLAARPGAGAAGGLGFGLMAFAGGTLELGSTVFARASGLEARMRRCHLVVTGEGSLDRSTLMGKGVGDVARRARKMGVPCCGIGGVATERAALARVFARVAALAPDLTDAADALARPAVWLERLASRIARTPGDLFSVAT